MKISRRNLLLFGASSFVFLSQADAGINNPSTGIQPPPNAPATSKLLLGPDGAPLVGADGSYLWSPY